uniref:Chemokine interleukin-8-like domain-containing protein n=1 Tax=Cyprinus carpio TaxID=7962 RepID=A0A8C1R9R8_CYPCA
MSRSIFLLSLVFLICLTFTEGNIFFIIQNYITLPRLPSAFCNTTEIIGILKKPYIKVCLNPNSKLGLLLN